MCSWCYGFSPIIQTLATKHSVEVVMGGLRAGETRPLNAVFRQEIQNHRRHVQQASGQPFDFDNGIPEGFVYNTEPACRAIVTVGQFDPALVLPMLDAVHHAFYAHACDVTQTHMLAELAEALGTDRDQFTSRFESADLRQQTEANFERARRFGVTGFPTTLLQLQEQVRLVSVGYEPFQSVEEKLLTLMH